MASDNRDIDYGKLMTLAGRLQDDYRQAAPYPHAVLEDLFSPALLDDLRRHIPSPDDSDVPWRRIHAQKSGSDMQVGKLGLGQDGALPGPIRDFIHELNSAPFLAFLERLTGIANLIPDPRLRGGGIHQVLRGGLLGVHADFTRHRNYDIDRRLNLLVFLNHDWQDKYGGHLELWTRDMSRCARSIRPNFGRCVLFNTDDDSFHGHPQALKCPPGITRKSIALYYYTHGREDRDVSPTAATDWQFLPDSGRPAHE